MHWQKQYHKCQYKTLFSHKVFLSNVNDNKPQTENKSEEVKESCIQGLKPQTNRFMYLKATTYE